METVSKSQEGRDMMAQAVKNIQEQEENVENNPLNHKVDDDDDDFKVTFPDENPSDYVFEDIQNQFQNITFPKEPSPNPQKKEHEENIE